MDLYGELTWRGLVYDASEGVADVLARDKVTLYSGFDPTAASLHVGSLLPIVTLARAQRLGHSPIALVGGGTGLIGDPSGKTAERQLLTTEQVAANVQGIRGQLARLLDFNRTDAPARLLNNAEWLTKLGAVEFMRDVGKHFSVNAMLARDSVKRRLEGEDGISYTEFSYSLLQAYDFLVLHEKFNCTLQIGGSDQWGNITAGMDLIRRVRSGKAHGLVTPLLTTASGTKFGKTESGAVWLDAALTSQQEFRQFWLNTDDRDVIIYLKFFTFLSRDEIEALEVSVQRAPEAREAQKVLASHVSALVHGDEDASRVEKANAALFSVTVSALTGPEAASVADQLIEISRDVPATVMALSEFEVPGQTIVDLVVRVGLASSKGEARRVVTQGGVSLNERRVDDPAARVTRGDAIDGRVFLLRKGARQRHLIRLT